MSVETIPLLEIIVKLAAGNIESIAIPWAQKPSTELLGREVVELRFIGVSASEGKEICVRAEIAGSDCTESSCGLELRDAHGDLHVHEGDACARVSLTATAQPYTLKVINAGETMLLTFDIGTHQAPASAGIEVSFDDIKTTDQAPPP